MNKQFHFREATQAAEALLGREGIRTLPVDPFAIAASRDIVVEPKPDTVEGVSGMLLRHGNSFGILYSTRIASEGFQRFSVGHELGHYFLDGHIDHVLPKDGIHTSHAGFVSGDQYEIEADHFAAGLLMPSGPFKSAQRKTDTGLAGIEAMADICKTSLTATAIRYADLSDEAIAVILSTGSTVNYCFLSDAMKSLPELSWAQKGSRVASNSVTARLNADPARVLKAERVEGEVDIMDWLGGKHSVLCLEEAVGLGRYGKTLTILSSELIGCVDDDDEDEDEDRLIESWTPRFRR